MVFILRAVLLKGLRSEPYLRNTERPVSVNSILTSMASRLQINVSLFCDFLVVIQLAVRCIAVRLPHFLDKLIGDTPIPVVGIDGTLPGDVLGRRVACAGENIDRGRPGYGSNEHDTQPDTGKKQISDCGFHELKR